ncbi:MAG TPA: ABC transporter permease [Anaerolineaceae bacterium]|nr:ABC transporter permease [Anaerolineaceae bacterium]
MNAQKIIPLRSRGQQIWDTFRTATWLGWQIESNWTDPFLFFVYSVVKPLSSAGILVIMYSVITNGQFGSPIFAYLYIGNAFYMYVGGVMTGVSWAVVDDREHYRTLKYIYAAPVVMPFYLLGRAMARILTTSLAVVITMTFGVLFLQVPFNPAQVDWPLLLVGLFIGIMMLTMMGLMLAGITLLLARHSDYLGDAVAGALYLFSGAIFPLEVLPAFLRPVGYVIPVAYWLEVVRRAIVGNVAEAFPTFSNLSNSTLLLILLGLTAFFGILGWVVFRACEKRARERGLIDQTTNY